jgi:hypothetical protein
MAFDEVCLRINPLVGVIPVFYAEVAGINQTLSIVIPIDAAIAWMTGAGKR